MTKASLYATLRRPMMPLFVLLAALMQAGCSNEPPACDAAQASNAVSRMLAARIGEGTGILQQDFAKRVRFVLERPLAATSFQPGQPRACHVVATYQVSHALSKKLQRAQHDPQYGAQGWRNWRVLLGLSSADDLRLRAQALAQAATEDEEHVMKDELSKILNIDEHFDEEALPAEITYYLNGPALRRDAEILAHENLLQHALASRDTSSGRIALPVSYTISATATARRFAIQASTDERLLRGVKLLEVLESALL